MCAATAANFLLPRMWSCSTWNAMWEGDPSKLPYPNMKDPWNIPILNHSLKNHSFIIDSGHWWEDPWATTKIKIWDMPATMNEAAIVYDISLRLLRFLIQNWASVYLTHYTTEFWIKDMINPTKFSSQDYNSDTHNYKEVSAVRGRNSIIGMRREVINNLSEEIRSTSDKKVTLVSVHADIAWDTTDNWIDVYYNTHTNNQWHSEVFAHNLCNNLNDPNSEVRDRNFWILRKVDCGEKVLIETANMNNIQWILRLIKHHWREKIARALGNWLKKTLLQS